MKVFLEGFSSLRVRRLVSDVRVLLVARTLVILRAVRLPAAEAHPAEAVLAIVALHVIAAAVLFDADVAFRALQRKTKEHHITLHLRPQKGVPLYRSLTSLVWALM